MIFSQAAASLHACFVLPLTMQHWSAVSPPLFIRPQWSGLAEETSFCAGKCSVGYRSLMISLPKLTRKGSFAATHSAASLE
jgi:hypothetical protein